MKICVDPGHGGNDTGAVGPTGLTESSVALAIGQYLAVTLESYSVGVRMTRTADVPVALGTRCAIANDWNADYFVSIHLNCDGPTACGIETLYKTNNGKALATPIQKQMIVATGDQDRGLKVRNDLYVLNGTKMPACLAETGFISNPDFETKFRTADYQQLLADAIAQGLAIYLHLGPGPEPVPPGPQGYKLLKTFKGTDIYQSLGDPTGIFFHAGMAIDADGAPTAYGPAGTEPLDYLANAGNPGNWWGITCDGSGGPYIQQSYHAAPGYYVSCTSLLNPQFPETNPDRFLNSQEIPFAVLPGSDGFGCNTGDLGLVYNAKTGDNIYAIVADRGPDVGEASIKVAQCLGVNPDPKTGGCDSGIVYLFWPNSGKGWQPVDTWFDQADALMTKWGGLDRLKNLIDQIW